MEVFCFVFRLIMFVLDNDLDVSEDGILLKIDLKGFKDYNVCGSKLIVFFLNVIVCSCWLVKCCSDKIV